MHGTTPPEQPQTPQPESEPRGRTFTLTAPPATLPVPGNAEFAVYAVVVFVFALLWWITDVVSAQDWLVATTALTIAYLLSRGIAKASRVYEQ